MINRKGLSSLLGMSEMESALEYMLQKAERAKICFTQVRIYKEDFKDPDFNIVGFCQLCMNGWIMTGMCTNGSFEPSPELIERMRLREEWKGLPEIPSRKERWFGAAILPPTLQGRLSMRKAPQE